MVKVNEASIVRLKIHGQNFEVLVDCDSAIVFRSGKAMDMRNVLAVQKVFSDSKKGLEASENLMKQVFGTADPLEVAKTIIQKGTLPLTTEYREKLRETKKKQIISIICRNAVDPKTHLPHPTSRIENALNEVKFHVDEFQDVAKQVDEALKKIRVILPIKFEMKEIAVKIPAEYAAKSYPIIEKFGKKLNEEWQANGNYIAIVEMPGGLEEEFHNKINALCHGDVETKLLKTK